jgi:hypothetical protein
MPDVIMLKAFIGHKQYDLCRDLDPDLLRASHGVQSLCSAMMSSVWEMTMEVAKEVHKERGSVYEPVFVDDTQKGGTE